MDLDKGRISELKLRNEVFRRRWSRDVVRIIHDKAWFPFDLVHPEDIRQFTYWLNFKRPQSWKAMDEWMRLHDMCCGFLKEIMAESDHFVESEGKEFKDMIDQSNINALWLASESLVSPGVHLRHIPTFHRESVERTREKPKKDVLLTSLEQRDCFQDSHLKNSHLFDPSRTIPINNLLNSTEYGNSIPIEFDPVSETVRRNSILSSFEVNNMVITRPFAISIEDNELCEGILKFTECVVYLCEETVREVNRMKRVYEFNTNGVLRRREEIRQYEEEKQIRNGKRTYIKCVEVDSNNYKSSNSRTRRRKRNLSSPPSTSSSLSSHSNYDSNQRFLPPLINYNRPRIITNNSTIF